MNPMSEKIRTRERNGYQLKRKGDNHDNYYNQQTKYTLPIKRHDFDKDYARYILKEAGLSNR